MGDLSSSGSLESAPQGGVTLDVVNTKEAVNE